MSVLQLPVGSLTLLAEVSDAHGAAVTSSSRVTVLPPDTSGIAGQPSC